MPLKQVDSKKEKTQALKNTFFFCTDRNQIFNFPSGKEMNGNSENGHFPQPEKGCNVFWQADSGESHSAHFW